MLGGLSDNHGLKMGNKLEKEKSKLLSSILPVAKAEMWKKLSNYAQEKSNRRELQETKL